MKRALLSGIISFSIQWLFAQTQPAEENSLREIKRQQEIAWNGHDWKRFSSYFSEDGTLINFVGQFWKGRVDILSHFAAIGDCCLSPTSLKFDVQFIRFLSPVVAIVYTEETLWADKDYEVPFRKYKKGETDYKMLTDVFIKTGNTWRIAAAQLTLMDPIAAPHHKEPQK